MKSKEKQELEQIELLKHIFGTNAEDVKMGNVHDFQGFGKMKKFQVYYYNRTAENKYTINSELDQSYTELFKVLEDRYGKETIDKELKNLVLVSGTQYYTPGIIASQLAKRALSNNSGIQHVLEPSCGNGAIIDQLLFENKNIQIDGIEKDFFTAEIAKIKYRDNPNVTIHHMGFEQFSKDQKYDVVISNIPFGNISLNYQGRDLFIEPFFFAKGQEYTKDGGELLYITGRGFLNGVGKEISTIRTEFASQMEIKQCWVLPNGTFADTEVDSNLIIAKKSSNQGIDITRLKECYHELGDYKGTITINEALFDDQANVNVLGGSGFYNVRTTKYGSLRYEYELYKDGLQYLDDVQQKLTIKENDNSKEQGNVSDQDAKTNSFHEIWPLELLPLKTKQTIQLDLFSSPDIKSILDVSAYLDEAGISKYGKAELIENFYHNKMDDRSVLFTIRYYNQDNVLHYLVVDNRKQVSQRFMDVKGSDFYGNKGFSNHADFKINILQNHFYHNNIQELYLREYSDRYRETVQSKVININELVLNSVKEQFIFGETIEIVPKKEVDLTDKYISDNAHIRDLLQLDKDRIYISRVDLLRLEELKSIRDGMVELRSDRHNPKKREHLRSLYDTYTLKHGLINEHRNQKYLKLWVNPNSMVVLSSMELLIGEKWIVSGLLNNVSDKEIKPRNEKEWYELMINNWAKLDMDWLVSCTNKTKEELGELLSDKIILNTQTGQYEIIQEILKGNLYDKLKAYKDANEIKQLILSQIPQQLSIEAIDIKLTERWLDEDLLSQFGNKLFDESNNLRIRYLNENLFIDYDTFPKAALRSFYINSKSRNMNGVDILKHALLGTFPSFNYTVKNLDGTKTTHVDTLAVEQSKNLIDKIHQEWRLFIGSLDSQKVHDIENKYNYLYNATITNNESPALLEYGDMNLAAIGIQSLNGKQVEGIHFAMQNFGGLLDHEVGTGKTLQICAVAHYMKKTGKLAADETVLAICPKASIPQTVYTYSQVFQNDFIMYPGKDDFNKSQKDIFLNRVINERPDVVFITPEQFSLISPSHETYVEYIEKEIDEFDSILDELNKDRDMNLQLIRELNEKRVIKEQNLAYEMEQYANAKSRGVSFEQLNIGFIIVDEAHKFKNLGYQTIHQRVKGLNSKDGSKNALNLKLAALEIQRKRGGKDFGLALYTGTPISNSVMEAYVFMSYLIPNRLRELGISKFDSFAALFFEKSIDLESSIGGDYFKEIERFRSFDKIPECAKLYQEMAHYVNAEIAGIDRPERKLINVMIKQDEPMAEAVGKIRNFIEYGSYSIGEDTIFERDKKSRMLEAYNKMQNITLYPKLEHPNFKVGVNKLEECANRVWEKYEMSNDFKGTQLIFLDRGVPTGSNINLYQILKNHLVAKGIKEEEIAFIHDISDKKKRSFYDSVNKGDIRIVITSREKGGVGINVQERGVALHLVDITNRLLLDIQAEGRFVRQGNLIAKEYLNNQMPVYRYAVEKSGDISILNSMMIKEQMMKQIRIPSGVRKINEGEFDSEHGLSQAAFISELIGDDSFIRKAKLEKEYYKIQSLHEYYKSDLINKKNNRSHLNHMIQLKEARIVDLIQLQKLLPTRMMNDQEEIVNRKIQILEKKYEEVDNKKIEKAYGTTELGAMFQKYCIEANRDPSKIGKPLAILDTNEDLVFNFGKNKDGELALYLKQISGNIQIVISEKSLFFENSDRSVGLTLNKRIQQVEDTLKIVEDTLKTDKESLIQLDDYINNKSFPQEDLNRMDEIRIELKAITEHIKSLQSNKKEKDNDIKPPSL